REVVRTAENLYGFLPLATVYRIVELRDDISQRATVVAKGHTTVHTTGCLLLYFLLFQWLVDFLIIFYTFLGIARFGHLAIEFHETVYLSHLIWSCCSCSGLFNFGFGGVHYLSRRLGSFLLLEQYGFVILRHHFDKVFRRLFPVFEDPLRRIT